MPVWTDRWNGYTLTLTAPHPLGEGRTTQMNLDVVDSSGKSVITTGHLRYRPDGFYDAALDQDFDVVIISTVHLTVERTGLGTHIFAFVARTFPDALIWGENPNEKARGLHVSKILPSYPTRLLMPTREGAGMGDRETPGVPIDPNELRVI